MRLFCLLAVAAGPAAGQALPWVPFHWEGATLAGRHFDKVAITVPVTLDNLPHKFNMQLDLGAVTTRWPTAIRWAPTWPGIQPCK